MTQRFTQGTRCVVALVAAGFLLWASPPPLAAAASAALLGPEAPILTPADSVALSIDVPDRLRAASSQLDQANRLWKQGRTRESQWAAERLLASLHDLRASTPLSYSDNQEYIRLVRQAGGTRLRGVRLSLSQRTVIEPDPGPVAEDDSEEADEDAPPAAMLSPTDSMLAVPAGQLILPEDNDRVQKWIDFFTGRGRRTFAAWLQRSGEYTDMMIPVLERNGLPSDLIHLVFVESGFNPKAYSSSAASGPWQFIQGTAKIFGLNVGAGMDERRDPKRSTEAAAQYLKHLYSLFHDWPLALAAYNSGEGTVLRALSRQNTFDYWSLDLPRQTKDYVPEFMAALTIAKNPAAYGFDGPLNPALTFDEIVVPGRVNLGVLAYITQAPLDLLQKLNPGILRKQAPAQTGGTVIRLPEGTGDDALRRLEAGDFPASLNRPEPVLRPHPAKHHGHASKASRHGSHAKAKAKVKSRPHSKSHTATGSKHPHVSKVKAKKSVPSRSKAHAPARHAPTHAKKKTHRR